MPSDVLGQILATHPGLIDSFVGIYLTGWIVGHCMRAGWPEEAERPRPVRIVMALADAMQLVFFGPIKDIVRMKRDNG